MKPLVSILIAAYNAEPWIADALRSALAQTWERKEIIVVDDGSSDRTLAIARQFENDGVHVITQKNQGAAAARNAAFSLCNGDYMQWLDADDLLARDKIALQMRVIEECQNQNQGNRLLLSSAWGRFMYRHSHAIFTPTALWCDLSPAEWLTRKLSQNLYMQTGTWLISRELTEAAGPWDISMYVDDDGEYMSRVLLASSGVRFVREAKVYYRASAGSLSYVGRSDKKIEAQLRSIKLHIGYLRTLEDSERTRAACMQYLQNWLPLFYPARPDLAKQVEQMAADLGGKLEVPRFSWKYAWIKALFGWGVATRAQDFLPQRKWFLLKSWDKALFAIENRHQPHNAKLGSDAEAAS